MKKSYILYAALAAIILGSVAAIAENKNEDTTASPDFSRITKNLEIFNAAFKEMNIQYVDTIDIDKVIESAFMGMFYELDPYTEYIPEKNVEEFMVISTGEFGGIGTYLLKMNDGSVALSQPYEGSPAIKAGLRSGDRLITINGDSVKNMPFENVSKHLKGEPGTTVHVQVRRPYVADSIIDVDVVRAKISLPAIPYYGMQPGGIGYIALNTFNEHSYDNVRDALTELLKNPELKGLVFDLRGNGGGLLESAVQIAGLFVPKGTEILKTKGRTKLSERTYKTTNSPLAPNLPLAILIDGGTASAAEIVSGSMQDLDRAVIIGSRSFGKGLVQTTRPLPYGSGIKITTARYYIPSGRLIQAIDYSRRNEDGSIAPKPDSLANDYYTRNGRLVKDGGGISPDIKIDFSKLSNRFTNEINRKYADFDYATYYLANHPEIAPVEDFEVTDEMYAEFASRLNPKDFSNNSVITQLIDRIQSTAADEGILADSVKAEIAALRSMLKPNLEKSLKVNEKPVKKLIADEIVGARYHERGRLIQALKDDESLQRATEILSNPVEYRKILASPTSKPKKK